LAGTGDSISRPVPLLPGTRRGSAGGAWGLHRATA
jgi:hypothetical protein